MTAREMLDWTLGAHRSINEWVVCQHPERKPDEYATFHVSGCSACRIAMEVAVQVRPGPDDFDGWWIYRDLNCQMFDPPIEAVTTDA